MMAAESKFILSVLERIDKKSDLQGEDLSAIKEHLKTLNGKVVINMNVIEKNRNNIAEINLAQKVQWAKITSLAIGISFGVFTIGAGLIKLFGIV